MRVGALGERVAEKRGVVENVVVAVIVIDGDDVVVALNVWAWTGDLVRVWLRVLLNDE